tara:strand:- start:3719 stop:4435 length:717 start_codon:yes stop_codon:yes gene_type:complete
MSKICLIKQGAGIGDILFCQKIAKVYADKGYTVIWPIINGFNFLVDYIKADEYKDKIYYVDMNTNYPYKDKYEGKESYFTDDFVLLCLDTSQFVTGKKIMESKYIISNIDDFSDWSDYLHINRNLEKEKQLMEHLGIGQGQPYSFVNKNFGSPPNYMRMNFNETPKHQVVNMGFHEGFNVFDWCGVLENATEIFTVETSINIIMETLKLKTDELHTYSRRSDFSEVEYMFKLNWNYHT